MRNNHLAARRDVENNEVPTFNEAGQFLPTSGMQVILGQPEYHPLFNLESEGMNLEQRKAQRSALILKLEKPVLDLRLSVDNEVGRIQRQREEILQELDQKKDDIVKHEAEMRYNGFTWDTPDSPWSLSSAVKNRLGPIIVFVLIEVIVFGATYYVLEEIMGTMELIVRVLINGVVFGSIDFIRRRTQHTWRSQFLLFFLFIYAAMLIGPIATQSLYDTATGVSNPWSMAEETVEQDVREISVGEFLITYHQYLLFVLWMSLFVVYISFSKPIPAPVEPDSEEDPESRVWPLIHAGMSNDIKKLEQLSVKLDNDVHDLEWQALENLEELHAKLQSLDKEYEELNAAQSRLHTKREILLSNIMAALKGYESHYMQQLEKTPKNLILQPRWPSKDDIKAYFNIKH